MKKYFLIFILSRFPFFSYCQNVGINKDGSSPDPSAMLDVKSTDKGLLLPRMTTIQRIAIASPANGLAVFDTDTKSFWFFNGAAWIESATGSSANFWTKNGNDLSSNNSGNIGIGTNTPSEKLTILSAYDTYGLTLTDGNIKISSYIGKGQGAWFGTQSNHPFHLYTNGNGTPNITFHQNFETDLRGPKSRLKFYDETSSFLLSGDVKSNGKNLEIAASKAVITGTPGNLILQADDASVIGLPLMAGNVGIGTSNPTYKLSVNGGIHCKEVVVESGWADYVFNKEYELPTLHETEIFILQNKHLPNIPSSEEIEQNGLNVGEIQKKMMEKIEELTLYIIEANKRIEELEKIAKAKK